MFDTLAMFPRRTWRSLCESPKKFVVLKIASIDALPSLKSVWRILTTRIALCGYTGKSPVRCASTDHNRRFSPNLRAGTEPNRFGTFCDRFDILTEFFPKKLNFATEQWKGYLRFDCTYYRCVQTWTQTPKKGRQCHKFPIKNTISWRNLTKKLIFYWSDPDRSDMTDRDRQPGSKVGTKLERTGPIQSDFRYCICIY